MMRKLVSHCCFGRASSNADQLSQISGLWACCFISYATTQRHSRSTDLWQSSVLSTRCVIGAPTQRELEAELDALQIPPYPAYSNSIKGLIGGMLQESASRRPNIFQVHEQVCRLRGVAVRLENVSRPAQSSLGARLNFHQHHRSTLQHPRARSRSLCPTSRAPIPPTPTFSARRPSLPVPSAHRSLKRSLLCAEVARPRAPSQQARLP